MARRARRTPLEKYQEELTEVQASIRQYEDCLETLREKEGELREQILMEKFITNIIRWRKAISL